jgi:monoamine oxidase
MTQVLSDYDIAIVGAGAAGLAAARTACDLGLGAVVLEAKGRVGGRAHTESASLGIPFDHGCRWLHSAGRNPFVGIARRLGYAPFLEQRVRQVFLGDRRSDEAETADWADFAQRNFKAMEMAGEGGLDVPAAQVIERGQRWSALFDAWCAMMTAFNTDAVSTLDYARYVDTKENWVVREGFGALIAHYGAGLPVTLNAPVTRISWSGPGSGTRSGSGVRLETPQGTVGARAAIVTVSTAVLAGGAIRFDPALPDRKQAAIEAVPMGAANKIGFALRRDVFGDPAGRFSIFSSDKADAMHFHVRPCGEPVVGAYVGGRVADALEKDGPDAMKALAMERLKAIFGAGIEKEVTGSVATAWRGDAAIGGGYSMARPGQAHRRADLATPLADRLFFAGEATSIDFYSTAHGAYFSGVAAAEAAGRVLGRAASAARTHPSTGSA